MKKMFQYILMAVAVVATASCSNELDEALHPAGNGKLQFVVSDFPTFGEGTQTRVVGTQDEGKTAWADGDKILVHLYSQKFGDQAATLTFDAGSNTWESDDASLSYLENETPTITAVYAPDCEIKSDMTIGLLEGKKYGEEEYIPAKTSISGNTLDIRFERGRTYSRLRIAAMPEATLTVSTEGFTPAGATEVATAAYTLTADEKGNAYLYGVFAADGRVKVETNGVIYADYTFEETTEARKSYALDTLKDPGYTYDKSTNTYFVKNTDGLYAWNNAVQAIMSTGSDSNGDKFAEYSKPLPNLTLTADIVFLREGAITNWTPPGEYKNEMYYPYTGIIDGGGHKISGLYMYNDIADRLGFLGMISNSVVKDLTIDDSYIISTNRTCIPYYAAFVVGESYNSEITNCHVTKSEISLTGGHDIAGVVSWLYDGTVSGCSVDYKTTISGEEYVAGVVCCNSGGVVSGCINEATVKGNSYVGGVVVENTDWVYSDGVVIACGNTGELISGTQSIGGIVAYCDYYCPVYGSWTKDTFEYDDEGKEPALKDGMGYIGDERYVDGCYSGNGSHVISYMEYMNYVIDEYNKSAAEGKKCLYKWYKYNDTTYPYMMKSTQKQS